MGGSQMSHVKFNKLQYCALICLCNFRTNLEMVYYHRNSMNTPSHGVYIFLLLLGSTLYIVYQLKKDKYGNIHIGGEPLM